MRVYIDFMATVVDDELPMAYRDKEYLEEMLTENMNDIFTGAGIDHFDVMKLIVEIEESL